MTATSRPTPDDGTSPNIDLPARGAGHAARAQSMSRELALCCARDGRVVWADERALRLAGVRAGTNLIEVAAPGSDEKLGRFLQAAHSGETDGWELLLVADDGIVTVAAHGEPAGADHVLIVGSLLPTDYGTLLGKMSEAMSELATLHRETDRQQREIDAHTAALRSSRAQLDEAARAITEGETNLRDVSQALEESTRGLKVLYSELDEKDSSLRVVSEARSRFVASVSHELRTPLNSILGLARLLLAKQDGELTAEQERQIGYIRRSAEALSDIVNDLLDLAKMDSGKFTLRPAPFEGADLVASLRGMLRPLATSDRVALVFDPVPADVPRFDTDEGKVAQVLRNLVSNALKFTREGEVRIALRRVGDDRVAFDVHDTGIGIAPEDQHRIFDEFTQILSAQQAGVKGTGLGLSVSRRLAELLGGTLTVASSLGRGSTFTLEIPAVHPETVEMAMLSERGRHLDPQRRPVLVVEDDRQTLFLYEKYLEGSGFQVVPARSIDEARALLEHVEPAAVVLDIILEGETTWTFLAELKQHERTRDIPTLVVTVTDREQKARALGADEFFVKPLDRDWLLRKLGSMAKLGPMHKLLVVDDDEVSRYLVRKLLHGTEYQVIEAADGPEGIRRARDEAPQLIILDFVMPQMTAFEVLDELKCDPRTRGIPVIISTSKSLSEQERARLQEDTAAILSKHSLSREIAIGRIREALQKAVVQ